jgi:hypothetical protein
MRQFYNSEILREVQSLESLPKDGLRLSKLTRLALVISSWGPKDDGGAQERLTLIHI